jgi:hypothetical protein
VSVVGVRLTDGRMLWAEGGSLEMSPLDTATVQTSSGRVVGSVFVAPGQLIRPPPALDGKIVEVIPRERSREPCGDLPGGDLPSLGSTVQGRDCPERGSLRGRVTALNPVKRLVTVTLDDGTSVEIAAEEL